MEEIIKKKKRRITMPKNYGPGSVYRNLEAAYAAYCADRNKQRPNDPNVALAPKQRFAQIWGWEKGLEIGKK